MEPQSDHQSTDSASVGQTMGPQDLTLGNEFHTDSTSDVEKSAAPPTVNTSWPSSFPEGGKGWLVVLGAFIVNGCSFGYVTAFGVYQAWYQQNQLSHKPSSDIAWIGSIQVCFMFGSGLFAGGLFDKYGARVLVIPASIAYVFSIMMTSICKEYYQFILAQGIVGGISIGFLFTPSMSAVNHYFMKKRGAALGMVATGSSAGGVIFPIILQNCFRNNTLGFGWGVRIVGFTMIGLLSIACILIKARLPPREGKFFMPRAFLQPSYVLLIAGVFFVLWGMFVPFFYVTEYGINVVHMSDSLAFYLVAILSATSLFGRIITGAMGDKLGWMTMLSFIGLCNGILIFCWPSTHSNAGLIVWTAIFGFFSGAVFALFPASFALVTPKPQLIGTYLGQAMGVLAISGLTGTPIAGAIITKYGFPAAAYFAGASMLAGSFLIASARLCYNRKLTALV